MPGSRRSCRRSKPSSTCARTPSMPPSAVRGPRAGRRSRRSTSAAARRRSWRPPRSPSWSSWSASASASRPMPRSRSRPIPGRTSAATPAAWAAAGVTRLSFGAQSMDDRELKRIGRRHHAADVADAVAEARAAGIGSVSLDLLYDMPDSAVATWMTTLDAALELGAGPPLALRADARRPRRRGPDRSRGRPPPDDARRPPLARDRPARAGRGPRGRAVPPRGRAAEGGRVPRLRDQQLGAARATRAGTT